MWGSGLIKGMRITMRNMFRGPITLKYPYEKYELPERARWSVAPTFDEGGNHKCTACMSCVRVCPDHILDLQMTVAEDKTKHIEFFRYEVGACMMCGLCVEACPFDAIHMSHDYELAVTDPGDLTYDLLSDTDAAKPKREPRPAPAAGAGTAPEKEAPDA